MKTASYHFLTKLMFMCLALSGGHKLSAQNTEVLGTLPRANETVTTSYLGIGHKGALDTYLSNAAYGGMSIQLKQKQTTARYREKYFSFHDISSSISFSSMTNRLGGGSFMGGEWNEIFTWNHPLVNTRSVDILFGPSAVSSIGFLYNQRNSNNPAQFKCLLSAAVSGKAIYRFNVLRRHMALSTDITLPLLGFTFAPDFDEPYYFLAAYSGLGSAFRVASPFNAPAAFSDLTLTIPAGRRNRLSLTYEANYMGYNINGHRSAIANHAALVGFTRRLELKND